MVTTKIVCSFYDDEYRDYLKNDIMIEAIVWYCCDYWFCPPHINPHVTINHNTFKIRNKSVLTYEDLNELNKW